MPPAIPRSTLHVVEKVRLADRHCGVQLDKLSPVGDQMAQTAALRAVCQCRGPDSLLQQLRGRRVAMLKRASTAGDFEALFQCTTTGPLTLHLARAGALENAGICLHPLYGFVYLPGTGLKGLARAYAETLWLAAQPETERCAAWRKIEQVFGWAPGSDRIDGKEEKPWKPTGCPPRRDDEREHAGEIVFHDAWPTAWPQLIVDIVNNHHPDYYQHDDNHHPPGDWENPVPVYFLAVPPGTTFEFAVSKRRDDITDACVQLAREWLMGGLCHLGAGAKTAAGYGGFKPADAVTVKTPGEPSAARATFETTLELVTPAFLAGASQTAEDCDLRSATLRGLLRWWWRTMHAGHVDAKTLRAMESAIWGDTERGGAVTVRVQQLTRVGPIERPGKVPGKDKKGNDALFDDKEFVDKNGLARGPRMTTQGLFYAAYGTDEIVKENGSRTRKRRWCIGPGSQWRVTVACRHYRYREVDRRGRVVREEVIDAESMAEQARCALWLLCAFGGVGSKSRKGFGSITIPDGLGTMQLRDVSEAALRWRNQWTEKRLPMTKGSTGTACLERAAFISVPTRWKNTWFAIDRVGAAMQAFAQADPGSNHGKHCAQKASLGVPRKIDGPFDKALGHQNYHRPPRDLETDAGARYASQALYHLTRSPTGELDVTVVIFRPDRLWNSAIRDPALGGAERDSVLDALRQHLQSCLTAAAAGRDNEGRAPEHPSWNQRPSRAGVPAAAAPVITIEEIKQRLATLPAGQVLLKVWRNNGPAYQAERYRKANVPQGFQTDNGWTLRDGPAVLAEGTVVLARETGTKTAAYAEMIGRLQAAQRPDRRTGPQRRR